MNLHNCKVILFYLLFIPCAIFANKSNSILILRSNGEQFETVSRSFQDEIGGDFTVQEMVIDSSITLYTLGIKINQFGPRFIVLINNEAIRLLKQYYQALPDLKKFIPSLSLMGVYIEKSIKDLPNSGGISYEIPLVTSVINLRSVINKPISTVGVVYREFMFDYIELNKEYCKQEKIKIVDRVLWNNNKNNKAALKKNLKELLQKETIDAIWIVNDNVLLAPDIVRDIWIPLLNKYKKPTIVGVEALVNPSLQVGTIAVLPDPASLGIQAAEILYISSENNWDIEKRVVPPLSVYKIVNLKLLSTFIPNNEFTLENIDKVLQ